MPNDTQGRPDTVADPESITSFESLDDLLRAAVAQWGEHPAMDFLGRRWLYWQLGALVDRATRGLQDLGVGPGVKVGLCLPNTPYYVVLYYAVLRAGGTVVNYNPLYVERELTHQILDSGTTIMAVMDLEAVYRKVANVASATGLKRLIVCPMAGILPPVKALLFRVLKGRDRAVIRMEGIHIAFADIVRSTDPAAHVTIQAADLAVLQYTGGTTGVPKGVMLSHANLAANSRQARMHWTGARPGHERVLAVLPFFHVFAMTSVLNYAVGLAAEIVILPRFQLKAMLKAIKRRRVTIVNAVPTIYTAVNAAAEKGRIDLRSLAFSVSGGAPLPPEVRERFIKLTGCKLVEGYGLSEASPVVSCNPPDGAVKPGSAGLPMADTEIEIRDPDSGRLLATGERGEVCVRGPQVMRGYWQRPEDTEAVFVAGALRTGDIGYLDADGYLFLVDRIKDVIFCGGYNVYPRVLEDALYEHPAVLEATVIGVPDSYRGQVPKAFVVLRQGTSATPAELRSFLAGYVSKIELPRDVVIRESLPKTMIGKLSKKELVAEEAANGG
jgi:long-chain acyl-CoA synthetase